VVSLLGALTIAPYLGGVTIWSLGSSPVTIPTIEAAAFWPLVFLTPIWWCIFAVRLIGAPILRLVLVMIAAFCLSFVSVLIHTQYPAIALSSITPNLDQTHRMDYDKFGSWTVSSEAGKYCYFRTPQQNISEAVHPGCALRIDRVVIDSSGYANTPDVTAFDLAVYLGTGSMPPKAVECGVIDPWRGYDGGITEVQGNAAIRVEKKALKAGGILDYSISFDFENKVIAATVGDNPAVRTEVAKSRKDIFVKEGSPARFQVWGRTLWGGPTSTNIKMDALSMRVRGRLQCGFWNSIFGSP
jgi:hypothetical protein